MSRRRLLPITFAIRTDNQNNRALEVRGDAGNVVGDVKTLLGGVDATAVTAAISAQHTVDNDTYAKPDVIAPAATGVAATDTANLQAAINSTPSGGLLWIRPGTYKINAALTLAGQITIEGTSAVEVMGSITADTTALNAPPAAPYLSGAVIVQTAAATDAFRLSAGGVTANIRHLGIKFDTGIAFTNTGHGFNMTGPTAGLGGHDSGLVWANWDGVVVFGTDGTHYAFYLTNPINCTMSHLRAYGGGGIYLGCDSYYGNYGNSTFVNPYVSLFAGTTADAYRLTSRQNSSVGRLNFVSFIRPQGIGLTMGPSKFGASAVVNTQSLFYVDDNTPYFSVIAPDFETAVSGQTIRLPTSQPMFFDPGGTFPAPANPIALVRGSDGNRALYSDLTLGRYNSQPLANRFTKAGLGTTPPTVLDDSASDSWRGKITFGTGTSPTTGDLVDIRFDRNRGVTPYPFITPLNAATAALGLYISTITAAGFVVACTVAPTASQVNTTYAFAYTMIR